MAADGDRRHSLLAAAICFVLPLELYVFTAARTIQGGDAGEFGLLSQVGGVAHAPGYPLCTALLRLFGLLPVGPPFFRAALMSAVAGAAAAVVIQRVAFRLTGNVWASALAALVLAVSPPIWRLSGIPEVFTLHALIVAGVMLLALRMIDAPGARPNRASFALGLVLGLGGANHQTTIFTAPLALAALVAVARRRGAGAWLRASGAIFAGGVLGLTPYLLLLVWGRADPTKAWIWGETTTWHGLVDHILRRSYGTFHLYASADTGDSRATWVGQSLLALAAGNGFVLFLAGIAGIFLLWRSHRLFAAGLLGSLLLAGVVFPTAMNQTLTPMSLAIAERFFVMPLVLFAPLVAVGLAACWQRSPRLTGAASLAVLLFCLATHLHAADWRSDTNIDRYVAAATDELPPGAVVLGTTDTLRPAMAWRRLVERVRPDIVYVDATVFITRWHHKAVERALGVRLPYRPTQWPPGELAAVLARVRPTFLIPDLAAHAHGRVQLEGWGLLYKVRTEALASADPDAQQERLERATQLFGPPAEPADVWSTHILECMAAPWSDLASSYDAIGRAPEAEAALKKAGSFLLPDVLALEKGMAK